MEMEKPEPGKRAAYYKCMACDILLRSDKTKSHSCKGPYLFLGITKRGKSINRE